MNCSFEPKAIFQLKVIKNSRITGGFCLIWQHRTPGRSWLQGNSRGNHGFLRYISYYSEVKELYWMQDLDLFIRFLKLAVFHQRMKQFYLFIYFKTFFTGWKPKIHLGYPWIEDSSQSFCYIWCACCRSHPTWPRFEIFWLMLHRSSYSCLILYWARFVSEFINKCHVICKCVWWFSDKCHVIGNCILWFTNTWRCYIYIQSELRL